MLLSHQISAYTGLQEAIATNNNSDSYVITVINPKIPRREEYLPTTEEAPKYPEFVLDDFNNDENFVPLSRNLRFIDYQNAQIILIGAEREKIH